jgi:hypothetical protein
LRQALIAVGVAAGYNLFMAKGAYAGPAQTPLRPRKDSAMFKTTPRLKFHRIILSSGVVIAALFLLTAVPTRSAQDSPPLKNGEALSSTSAVNDQAALTAPKQNGEPKKSKLEKTKTDAAELSALADKLRDELKKMNVNVFSLDVIQKTEEVEKLAKKIKGEAYAQ